MFLGYYMLTYGIGPREVRKTSQATLVGHFFHRNISARHQYRSSKHKKRLW